MNPFYTDTNCTASRMKRYARFVRKMRKFGAYMEATEYEKSWIVTIHCPKVHTDRLGNMAIKQY